MEAFSAQPHAASATAQINTTATTTTSASAAAANQNPNPNPNNPNSGAMDEVYKKYGKLPKNPVTAALGNPRKFFDSGDYALTKAGKHVEAGVGTGSPLIRNSVSNPDTGASPPRISKTNNGNNNNSIATDSNNNTSLPNPITNNIINGHSNNNNNNNNAAPIDSFSTTTPSNVPGSIVASQRPFENSKLAQTTTIEEMSSPVPAPQQPSMPDPSKLYGRPKKTAAALALRDNRKFFDSGDYQLKKAGKLDTGVGTENPLRHSPPGASRPNPLTKMTSAKDIGGNSPPHDQQDQFQQHHQHQQQQQSSPFQSQPLQPSSLQQQQQPMVTTAGVIATLPALTSGMPASTMSPSDSFSPTTASTSPGTIGLCQRHEHSKLAKEAIMDESNPTTPGRDENAMDDS